ncbi:MAG: UDP-N-acetylmuramoyl-L-alanine--D-glutamate ligase [Ruminococcaceae bacterium]|nr:UDP-N-acetylmuramoyl-L-alanine--D-glutamate ligase [Oscillospiraceae bacterium]
MTLKEYMTSLRGRRIAVVGVGVSNRPLIDLLLDAGCDVTACDKRDRAAMGEVADVLESRGCKLKLGETYLEDLSFDVIFRTPGLHPRFLAEAEAAGAKLTSEMEAFFALCPCRIFAVTGSDGKTTTTSIIAELLKAAGYTVWLGGNIGTPLLDKLPQMKAEDMVVLELSSFQLHSMNCHPHVAVITNVSPNHLDVHPDYNDYIDAKKQIFRQQQTEDVLVLNADNGITAAMATEAPGHVRFFSRREAVEGVYSMDGEIYAERGRMMPAAAIRIPGEHNLENYMAAFAAVGDLVPAEVCRRVAEGFAGVEHRLEMVRCVRGVTYCNDSIASSPTRTTAGLHALRQKPILIAGGYDKNIPFDDLGHEICRHAKALVLCGATAEKILAAVQASPLYDAAALPIVRKDDFTEAVYAARDLAEEGDLVLLSPACASFDKFPNFAVRGRTFKKIVMEMDE